MYSGRRYTLHAVSFFYLALATRALDPLKLGSRSEKPHLQFPWPTCPVPMTIAVHTFELRVFPLIVRWEGRSWPRQNARKSDAPHLCQLLSPGCRWASSGSVLEYKPVFAKSGHAFSHGRLPNARSPALDSLQLDRGDRLEDGMHRPAAAETGRGQTGPKIECEVFLRTNLRGCWADHHRERHRLSSARSLWLFSKTDPRPFSILFYEDRASVGQSI